jgi:hypothetical protein
LSGAIFAARIGGDSATTLTFADADFSLADSWSLSYEIGKAATPETPWKDTEGSAGSATTAVLNQGCPITIQIDQGSH